MINKTMLYRQIHPNFVKGEVIMSKAFQPTSKDPCRLSAYNGDQIAPKAAWEHYTKKLKSGGVMGVTVGECEGFNMVVVFDGVPYKEHVSIKFARCDKKEIRTVSRHLKRIAQTRGWFFRANQEAIYKT